MEGEFLQVKNRRARSNASSGGERPYLKTRMCIYFEKNGRCRNGDQCPYAHSKEEIVSPQCHYGASCRFKDRCKFSHPLEVSSAAARLPPPTLFSTEDFPVVGSAEDAPSTSGRGFRDACLVQGRKTLTVGGLGGHTLESAVNEIKSSVESQPDTIFDLHFQ
jgi:hypothetical protein